MAALFFFISCFAGPSGNQLMVEMEIPFGKGTDHAEGIAVVPHAGSPSQVLIVYDSPGEEKKGCGGRGKSGRF